MTRQVINLGTGPDSGDGDTLREGGRKINENFGELYAAQILTSTDQLPEGLLNQYYTEARVTARFNSAALTGTPTAPTAAALDNSTQIATTAFVKNQNYATNAYVAAPPDNWVGGASPATISSALDTLAADNRGSVTFNYVTDADATLSTAQNNHAQLIITGAVLTAPRNLIVETRVHRFWVRNSTAQTITVKTAAGAGVAILAGNSKNIACDGANVVLSTMLASEIVNVPANGNTGTTVQAAIDQTINTSSTAQTKAGLLTFTGGVSSQRVVASNQSFGAGALSNAGLTGANNTATGNNALNANSSGGNNTAGGFSALASNSTGGSNTAIGSLALNASTTGGSDTATGHNSLRCNTTGTANTANGHNSLSSNVTNNSNTAYGQDSLATAGGNLSTVTITSGGTGYTTASVSFSGATISNAIGTATVSGGQVTAITITNPGAGYSNNPVITITGDGTGATATAVPVNTSASNTAVGAQAGSPPDASGRVRFDSNSTYIGVATGRDATLPILTVLTNAAAIGATARVGASNTMALGGTGGNAVAVVIGKTSSTVGQGGIDLTGNALVGTRAAIGGALSTQTVAAFLKVYGRTELTDAIQPAARTVATLPAASGYPAGYTFYCSNARTGRDIANTPQDGTGNGAGCLVTSNGTNWLTPTGLTASA